MCSAAGGTIQICPTSPETEIPHSSFLTQLINPVVSGQASPRSFEDWDDRVMSWIPCTSRCVYQQDGVCTLDSAAAAGLPALGGACVHFIPSDAGRLGSPHRYSAPGSGGAPREMEDPPSGGPGSGIG